MPRRRRLKHPKMSRKAQAYVSRKIRLLIHEGKPVDQAAAIAYSKARRLGYKIPGKK